MTIRAKLSAVIGVLVGAFVISVFTYFLLLSPIAKIQVEQNELTNLKSALVNESIAASSVFTASSFAYATQAVLDSVKASDDSFARVANLKKLPALSPSIKKAMGSIGQLKDLLDTNVIGIQNYSTELKEDAERYHVDINQEILTLVLYHQLGTEGSQFMTLNIVQLDHELNLLSDTLKASTGVIDKQYSVINTEVHKVQVRSTIIAIVIVLLLIGLTVVAAFYMTGRISKSIQYIEANIALMGSGDLTQTFTTASNDEIGRLSGNLNGFLGSLKGSIGEIKAASDENVAMKESLLAVTEEASSSANQIGANAESIKKQISNLDENLSDSARAVGVITGGIQDLNGRIQEQMSMVEESTASVTEMIASIDNVTKITDARRAATDKLVTTVSNGGSKMATTLEVLTQINESVASIEDITSIIKNISSQTNLLAMNAAIEAAHAGDAGRGFSVVADEIRKLAEASSRNSKEIGQILKVIVTKVGDAASSGNDMTDAFKEIEREVTEVHSSLTEIFESMNEVHLGGNQILEAMTVLREVSTKVNDGSTTINESVGSIGTTMGTVQQISSEVNNGMTEIVTGINEISSAVRDVLSNAERLGTVGEALNSSLSRFKTA